MDKKDLKELFDYERSMQAFEDEWNGTIPDRIKKLRIDKQDWLLNNVEGQGRPLVLPGDFKNGEEQLLGKEAYEAFIKALTYYKSKWSGYDYLALESIALMKAYEIKDKSFVFVLKSIKNALHDEIRRQARVRSHEFVVDDDNYALANQTVNEIDRMLDQIDRQSEGEMRPMEQDLRNHTNTRFNSTYVDVMDADYEFTEWEQIRESLVMYLTFAAGLPLTLRLEMEHLFTSLSFKQKSSLMAFANRENNRSDEKTVERICKSYLLSLSSSF